MNLRYRPLAAAALITALVVTVAGGAAERSVG
jgi:hypothetical protein